MKFTAKKMIILAGCCILFLCCLIKLSAQENEGQNRFDGTWLGEYYDTKCFFTITGDEVIVRLDKSGSLGFSEWVNFFEEESLNLAKGIIKASGNYVELTLTHIWGNWIAYMEGEEYLGDFDHWQTPEEFFERYPEGWGEVDPGMSELFTASGIVSGNRMRLRWDSEVIIITKQ
jgi:hypothetical protein